MTADEKGDLISNRAVSGEIELGIGEGKLRPGAHVAFFWQTAKEFSDGVRFLETGLRGLDHCVIFGHESANQAVCKVLEDHGFDVHDLIAQRRVTILGGDPSGERILETIGRVFQDALDRGAPLIRLLGNIGWGKPGWPGDHDLVAFEAKVTAAVKDFPCVVLCMYDVGAASGQVIRHAGYGTHPYVECSGAVQENAYYVRADLFLKNLAMIADAISERRRTDEALKKSEERLRTLLDINNAIVTKLTRDELFTAISEALGRVIPFDRLSLSLYDPELDSLRIVTYAGPYRRDDYTPIGRVLKLDDSPAGWAFLNQKPLLRRDLETERQTSSEERAYGHGFRSLCSLPLIVRGESIGAVTVGSLTKKRYVEEDAEFLMKVANQIAIAVDNMKAHEETEALKARFQAEAVYLQEEIKTEHNFEEIIGQSAPVQQLLRKVEQVAPTEATVLIYGETGTGKELLARAVHDRSPRKDRPLIKVNCGSIPAGLVESELFGHEKGAFTGATQRRVGRFELANGGTIFLDEVTELPMDMQVKLLRVLQEGEFERVGSSQTLKVDVRVIAATNRNVHEVTKDGAFRTDLFYRLNVFPLEVPPLSERKADIPLLVTFFLSKFAKKLGKEVRGVSRVSMENLSNYGWPGNIRELQNVIERAVVLASGPVIHIDESMLRSAAPLQEPSLGTLEDMERTYVMRALNQTNWVVHGRKGAAEILGMNPSTLRSRMAKLGITKPAL
ncbi:MAG TPA: sigma 54-interacting transcriptional regulator [Candidatus Binatia bacterium]|nr:sigma 54-interacting transcriptional regulator [Candidatus Binatia bacterium]